jgi:A/G-specific adenine glycosylase
LKKKLKKLQMTDFDLLICEWYRRNKRDLPWRETKDPYFIWLSEVILQQTRVDQGKNYYLKFISHYPTVQDLAMADEQEVLNDWQGLGYYSRARNLHASAKMIVDNFNGKFPSTYSDILSLKGVGEYTSAAIASFAFDLPHVVLDGNVFRILSRIFDVALPIDSSEGKKAFQKLAEELLPKDNAAEFNQAIMEFGAIHCTPVNPSCENCIFNTNCLAFTNKTVSSRPVKIGKTKVRKRFFNYLIFISKGKIILQKRLNDDIWKHLFEFPLIETDVEQNELEFNDILNSKYGMQSRFSILGKKHILSHQHLFAQYWFFSCESLDFFPQDENVIAIEIGKLQDFPLPRLIDRFLEENYDKIANFKN